MPLGLWPSYIDIVLFLVKGFLLAFNGRLLKKENIGTVRSLLSAMDGH